MFYEEDHLLTLQEKNRFRSVRFPLLCERHAANDKQAAEDDKRLGRGDSEVKADRLKAGE